MRKLPKSIKEIQDIEISSEEIISLVDQMGQLHQERDEVDWYTSVAILADRYPKDHRRVHCVLERMRCLTDLMGDERMRGWTIQGIEEGCLLTNEAIFRAVAKCPLKATTKRAWFDADEFFSMALGEMEPGGRA